MKTAAFVLALALAGAAPAFAQHAGHGSHSGHSGHAGHGAAASAQDSAATKAYQAANDKMHRDMDIAFTGDADADFLRGMIPHHQGAIDMVKIVLQHGKDPQVRKLAQEIVAAQEGEIAMMKKWLAERGK